MDILKNTEAMGKRIYEDLERINFIRTSTSEEETRAANIICEELAKAGMKAEIEEFMVETADIHTVSLTSMVPRSTVDSTRSFRFTLLRISETRATIQATASTPAPPHFIICCLRSF